jgi:hypothetical protein
MGPGTDYIERYAHGHKPVDYDDYVSLLHDRDYDLSKTPIDIYYADLKAIKNYPNDLHGSIGRAGLILKNLVLPMPLQQLFAGGKDSDQIPDDILHLDY